MAHPPIHPTAYVQNLDGDKKKLYELVVRHFLACCSKDAVGAETAVEAEIAEEIFVSKGLMIKETNYLDVYIYDKWSDKNIPVFVQGEAFRPTDLSMTSGRTQVFPNIRTHKHTHAHTHTYVHTHTHTHSHAHVQNIHVHRCWWRPAAKTCSCSPPTMAKAASMLQPTVGTMARRR